MASGVAAVVTGLLLRLSVLQWAVVVVTIALVLALEAMNCAVERVVDLACPEQHELARQAKDLAAASVLIASIGSAVIGAVVFGSRAIALWHGL